MKVETIYQNPPFDKLEIIYEDDGTYNIVCSTKSHGSKVMGGTRVKDIMCIEIKYVPMPWG